MTPQELAAAALAHWTLDALRQGSRSLGRQELPDLDVRTFVRAFAAAGPDCPGGIALALVGFGTDAEALRDLVRKAGVTVFSHLAADLHSAAMWRNRRAKYPIIVAYARGKVAGVSTLRHFDPPTSRALATRLLAWAREQKVFTGTTAHERLLDSLLSLIQDDDSCSFEQLRSFLAAWSRESGQAAPRKALPALGLLADPSLFADPTAIRHRLEANVAAVAALRDRSPGHMQAVRKRLTRARQGRLLRVFAKLQDVRRNPSIAALSAVALDDALAVLRPRPESGAEAKPDVVPDLAGDHDEARPLDERRLQAACADALLEDRAEELTRNADALSVALRDALQQGDDGGDEDSWSCDVQVHDDPRRVVGTLDRRFVSWVHHFCGRSAWGGLIQTKTADLRKALEDFDRPGTLPLEPERLLRVRGEELGLTKLLRGWDEDLAAKGKQSGGLEAEWLRLKQLREELLGSLDELTHFPLEWFAGRAPVAMAAKEYLQVSSRLYGAVARNFGAMSDLDREWAKATLDGLLALDVVQVRVDLADGKGAPGQFAFKAVLLPTHPLHLWRWWRLSLILRGLGKELAEADKDAVIREAAEPIQFLSVIFASPLPGARGGGQVLPVANDLHRLATFENLRNAYNGPDGQDALVYAVERYASSNRNHVSPLRLVLVNPPQPGSLVLSLIKLLDGRKRDFIPRLRVEIRGSTPQEARLRDALLFDTREREIIEEKIATGRLELAIDRKPERLDAILEGLRVRPTHLVAVFDEAPVSVRRGGVGVHLPMSPFCVRRQVRFQQRWSALRLEVTAGDPPFFEFLELVKHAEGSQGEGTPYAFTQADDLRKAVDGVLTPADFGAHWFFLADRALPDEGDMQAQRLLRRREGQRQVLLAARDYEPLARLMLPVFQEYAANLLVPPRHLQRLLAEGAHLVGAGLLDVVKSHEGLVIPARVIGLMGTLLAARAHRRRHPDALVVSTDSQLARTWLRLGTQGDRCDLLAVREAQGQLVVECIEVKTAHGKPRSSRDSDIARGRDQLLVTLAAVREGLGDPAGADSEGRHLAAPRNEMLKEVLVHGCMARHATREQRACWAGWLTRLFGATPEMPQLEGIVVDVALGSAQEMESEEQRVSGFRLRLEHLAEAEIQSLLEMDEQALPAAPSTSLVSLPMPDSPPPAPDVLTHSSNHRDASNRAAVAVEKEEVHGTTVPDDGETWPPPENAFGLIGQTAAATKLSNKLELARGTGRRFTDTLLVGSAGVGKSSLARAVAARLLKDEPIFFSGSDLRQPTALIDKLAERRLAPRSRRGRVRIAGCLVFIDEVHAVGRATATALLSAMDDTRVATIGGVEYDFCDVVFVAATTDKGLLTDALVSRMDLIPLEGYSLQELAGVVSHHSKRLLGGFELPREVCVEVAARSRCNPRRAVRSLENDLLSEFYSRLDAAARRAPGAERAAAVLMTREAVAAYYDAHGIDANGVDSLGREALKYLKQHGATPEDRLCRGLHISNRADFVELIEYLTRLGLTQTDHNGRTVTRSGREYLGTVVDLRGRI